MDSFSWLNSSFNDFADLLDESELKVEPVDLETFLYDKYYLGLKLVSEKQQRLITVMSQIYLPHTLDRLYGPEESLRIQNEDTFHEVVAQLGKGSGKDFSSRVSFCYIVYKLHCLKNPLEYYNKANGTYIDLLNIAVNADQAQNVFFEPLKNMMALSPWFKEQGFEPRKKEVYFNNCPIRLFSGNSEAEAWEGLDLMMVVLDEIAAFKTESQLKGENKNRLSAKAIYDMSANSVASRFPEVGKVILLSFPRFKGDYIQQRYAEAVNEPKVFTMKACTWEVNPNITREQLEPQFRRNPVEARSRFMCEPPEMVDAYFRDPMRVRNCFQGNWTKRMDGNYEIMELKEQQELFPIDDEGRLKDWFQCRDDYLRYIHIDLAQYHDRAALAMCHVPGTRAIETSYGNYEQLPVVKMDLIKYWEAMPGQEIDFANIREFIILLCRIFPVGLVTFDQWQSTDMIQTLKGRGIRADKHPVNTNDYDNLLTCFYDGRFSGYFVNLLVEEELLKLQIMPNGKIDHPASGYKDGSDALAGAAWNACNYALMNQEIDLQILGIDFDDDRDYEQWEAEQEEKEKELIRRVYRSQMREVDVEPEEFNLELI